MICRGIGVAETTVGSPTRRRRAIHNARTPAVRDRPPHCIDAHLQVLVGVEDGAAAPPREIQQLSRSAPRARQNSDALSCRQRRLGEQLPAQLQPGDDRPLIRSGGQVFDPPVMDWRLRDGRLT